MFEGRPPCDEEDSRADDQTLVLEQFLPATLNPLLRFRTKRFVERRNVVLYPREVLADSRELALELRPDCFCVMVEALVNEHQYAISNIGVRRVHCELGRPCSQPAPDPRRTEHGMTPSCLASRTAGFGR